MNDPLPLCITTYTAFHFCGYKPPHSTMYLFSIYFLYSIFHIIGSQLPELQGMWGTIFAVASRVCAAGAYYACLQFASELFPTEIRGKGSSAFEISGGLGLFIQPQINYLVRVCHVLLQ